MDKKLFGQAIVKFLLGLLITSALLFIPAGSFAYWQAWLLIGILFVPMFIAGLIMMAKNPELLRKRLNAREKESEQKAVLAMSALMFIAAFVLAGLNYRFGWIVLPFWVPLIGTVLFLGAYVLYAEVLRENVYL
ncbi:MAG: isoprenylcysteine carboxylmethyltransferase family protein, partial [Lachnospiraceae bacterium]|nr:isoprenylcysteine carboxylmethyltransferase family protein [Lachnospiraceae bacterium]